MAAGFADHDRELAFIVELVRHFGFHQWLQVADLASSKASKKRGFLGQCASGLRDVVEVIQPDADDLVWIRDYRRKLEVFEWKIRPRFKCDTFHIRQTAGGK
jgi:hypothetical protein